MGWFSKSAWSGFETTAFAWGGIAAGNGSLWLGGAFLLVACAVYLIRTRGE